MEIGKLRWVWVQVSLKHTLRICAAHMLCERLWSPSSRRRMLQTGHWWCSHGSSARHCLDSRSFCERTWLRSTTSRHRYVVWFNAVSLNVINLKGWTGRVERWLAEWGSKSQRGAGSPVGLWEPTAKCLDSHELAVKHSFCLKIRLYKSIHK